MKTPVSFCILAIFLSITTCCTDHTETAIKSMLKDFAEAIDYQDLDDARDFLYRDRISDDSEQHYQEVLNKIEKFTLDIEEIAISGKRARVVISFRYRMNGRAFKLEDTYKMKRVKDNWTIADDLLIDILIDRDETEIEELFYGMVAAIKAGDYEKAKKIAGEGNADFESEEEFKAMSGMLKDMDFKIADIKVDGDTATATVKMTGEVAGQEIDQDIPATFKLVDGKWEMADMSGN